MYNLLSPAMTGCIAIHKEIVRVAEDVISPILYKRLVSLDQKGWEALARHITNIQNSIQAFFTHFNLARMEPEQISNLLDLQDALSSSMTFYIVFPDLAGVPKDKFPHTSTPPEFLQQSIYKETANELQRVITLVKQLSQSIDKPLLAKCN